MIDQYNQYMGGVDKCDQYQSNYDIARKSRKWWKKVFFRMLELAVINSYIVYRALNPEINGKKANRSHRLYRFALIHEMVQVLLDARANPDDVANAERNGRQSGNASSRLRGKHFPKSVYPKKSVCSACGYKSVNGKKTRKQTTDFCVKCNRSINICKACFEDL